MNTEINSFNGNTIDLFYPIGNSFFLLFFLFSLFVAITYERIHLKRTNENVYVWVSFEWSCWMGDCCFPSLFMPVRRREKREWEKQSTRDNDDWESIGEVETQKKGEREWSLEQSLSLHDAMIREKRRGGETKRERERGKDFITQSLGFSARE